MKDKPSNHVYGSADDSNRQPPPPEGLRGERAASGPDAQHSRVVNGMTITEASGIAAAEVFGIATKSEEDR